MKKRRLYTTYHSHNRTGRGWCGTLGDQQLYPDGQTSKNDPQCCCSGRSLRVAAAGIWRLGQHQQRQSAVDRTPFAFQSGHDMSFRAFPQGRLTCPTCQTLPAAGSVSGETRPMIPGRVTLHKQGLAHSVVGLKE